MNDPVVSVIMPAYNCEKYISKAIESVLAQNVPLELLVINDCSVDGTEDVVKRYLGDSRVHYYKNEENLGVAKTRNLGVNRAVGNYVAFLDSDDWWESDKLEKQVALISREVRVMCSTARELVDEDGNTLNKIIPVKETITYKMLLHQNSINCSSVLIRRFAALRFPMEHEDSHEDYITWMKILKEYGPACGIDEPLLKYRLSSSGKSGSKWKSAKMTYKAYRYMGFGFWRAAFYFCCYAVNGVWKYR